MPYLWNKQNYFSSHLSKFCVRSVVFNNPLIISPLDITETGQFYSISSQKFVIKMFKTLRTEYLTKKFNFNVYLDKH